MEVNSLFLITILNQLPIVAYQKESFRQTLYVVLVRYA